MVLQTKNKYARHNRKNVVIVLLSFVLLCTIIIILSGQNYKKYLNQGEYANCIKVIDYGEEGDNEGCLKHLMTKTPDYIETYGLHFESYHMKDVASAKQKYLSIKAQYDKEKVITRKEKIISDDIKVEKIYDNQNHVWYIVLNQSNVYEANGSKDDEGRNPRWFDMLKVNYFS